MTVDMRAVGGYSEQLAVAAHRHFENVEGNLGDAQLTVSVSTMA